MDVTKNISMQTRKEFMDFFRDDERLNLLSTDDKVEVFTQILQGSSDFTVELLEEVLSDYSVNHIGVYKINDNAKKLDER